MEDIPIATKCTDKEVVKNVTNSTYEIQKNKCLEKIKDMLDKEKPCCSFKFNQPLENKLLKELEEKGYLVRFTLTYNNKVYSCQLTVVNPNVEQISKPEEELVNIFSKFLNNDNNLNNDFLANVFRFQ